MTDQVRQHQWVNHLSQDVLSHRLILRAPGSIPQERVLMHTEPPKHALPVQAKQIQLCQSNGGVWRRGRVKHTGYGGSFSFEELC